MRLIRFAVVAVVLAQVAMVATSCGPAATEVPTSAPPAAAAATTIPTVAPSAAPAASPTSTEAVVPTPVPTLVPTEEPTAAPTPELVGPPTSPDQVPRITAEELKALIDSGADVAILDNRPSESYQMGHIAGAISFPWKWDLTEDDLWQIPWGADMVTYCDCGSGEGDSADVALKLIQWGVSENVKVLAHPALEAWIELGYPTE